MQKPKLNNRQIAQKFDLLSKLMELHDENPFRIKSYSTAYNTIRNLSIDLNKMTPVEIESVKGVGAKIAAMIREMLDTGQFMTLKEWTDKTPSGVVEMLSIKGIGPKKVKQIWKEMGIETIGELLYACNENRLIHYSGFGTKVQFNIKTKLEYYQDSQGKFLYARIIDAANRCCDYLKATFPEAKIALCGEIRRQMPVVNGIEILTNTPFINTLGEDRYLTKNEDSFYFEDFPLIIYLTDSESYDKALFELSCSADFLSAFTDEELNVGDENAILKTKNAKWIPPEFREDPATLKKVYDSHFRLIETQDIKGVIHNHSTYSDGLNTLSEMATYVHEQGYTYFVISDHSQSAFYANGLNENEILKQWQEIDNLNQQFHDGFKIYKGIESDILMDGSLDYPDNLLAGFDVIIASIHSVLTMDVEKATNRLLKAIENPFTDILGHPTGRLLLSRPGYPIHHKKIIDACAANRVAIEINANPQRLDLDWTWIPYALEKDVLISINPDAHSMESIHNIRYGVAVSRKGGLIPKSCLNSFEIDEFEMWLNR